MAPKMNARTFWFIMGVIGLLMLPVLYGAYVSLAEMAAPTATAQPQVVPEIEIVIGKIGPAQMCKFKNGEYAEVTASGDLNLHTPGVGFGTFYHRQGKLEDGWVRWKGVKFQLVSPDGLSWKMTMAPGVEPCVIASAPYPTAP